MVDIAPSSRVSAPSSSNHLILVDPSEVVFTGVKWRQTYSQCVRLTNPLNVPVEFSVRAGSVARYTLSPTQFTLRGGETALLEIRLRVLNAPQPKVAAGVPTALSAGVRDVFHIRSQFFSQRFHALWFPFGCLPQPPSSLNSRVAHDLNDATLEAYQREGGAAGIKAQRTETQTSATKGTTKKKGTAAAAEAASAHASSSAKELQATSIHSQCVDPDLLALEEKARTAEKKAEEARRAKEESELYRPLQRASLKSARAPLSASLLQPSSQRLPSSSSSTSPTPSPSPSPSHSNPSHSATPSSLPVDYTPATAAPVSAKEHLALSQKCRKLQYSLEMKEQEVQQWEFNYTQLEGEYRFLLQQLDSLHAASAAVAAKQPTEFAAQLDFRLSQERASQEIKNKKVLTVLRSKDGMIAEREATIQDLMRQLQEQAYEIGNMEEMMNRKDEQAKEDQRRLNLIIQELRDSLAAKA